MKLLKTQNLTQIRKKKIIQKKKINTDKHRYTEFREKLEILIKKIPDTSGLVTTTVLNTKS